MCAIMPMRFFLTLNVEGLIKQNYNKKGRKDERKEEEERTKERKKKQIRNFTFFIVDHGKKKSRFDANKFC